ncbi:MAG: DUF6508 domain-containing protein, partial [bacterium]
FEKTFYECGFADTNYVRTLEKYGLRWDIDIMSNADVSEMDKACIIALITAAFRAERFCEGALLSFIENGSMIKWLKRLKELDK